MMTLSEARKILARLDVEDKDVKEAIETAISVLPSSPARKSSSERLEDILARIRAHGEADPFDRTRNGHSVLWRQCVFKRLRGEGYMLSDIARVTGYDHSTVWFGCQQVQNGLDTNDRLVKKAWNELNEILYGKDEKPDE